MATMPLMAAPLEPPTPGLVGRPLVPRTNTAAATWALFLGFALVMAGNGLQGSLLGIRAQAEGFGVAVSGIVMACYFAGFFAGSLYAAYVLKNVGHIRVFAALASTASSAVLIHAVWINPVSWALMRFVFGLCMAGLYVVVESWLNELADNSTRGRLLSVYMVVTMAGVSIGQFLLNVADTNGFSLFILSSVLVSLSLVPVSLSATSAPPITTPTPVSIKRLWQIVPTGLVTSFFVGAASGTLLGIGAVYAATVGMPESRIAVFMTAPMVGALVGQMPIGWVSDRVSRRAVILAVSLAASAAAIAPTMFDPQSNAAIVSMFVLGATLFPAYSLGIAYTNDWLTADQVLGASGSLVRINGTGAVIGPLLAAGLMSIVSPQWFFWVMGGMTLAIAIYVGYRVMVAESPPEDRKVRFIAFPTRASSMAALLLPKRGQNRLLNADPADSSIGTEPMTTNPADEATDGNEVLASYIPLDGSVVVDVGCGAGELVRFMRDRGASPIGIECGEVMRQRALDADPNHQDSYLEGVGQDLPVDDGVADAVVFSYSLHHVPAEEMTSALKEAHRVLKPGGILYVVEPIPGGPSFESNRLVDDETIVRGLAQQALAAAGDLGFALQAHTNFDTEYSYATIDEWESLLVGIDPSRQARLDEVRDEAVQRFYDHATERAGRYVFRQPNDLKVFSRI